MVKRREFSTEELNKINTAIENDDFKEIVRLLQEENRTISMFAYEAAVKYKRAKILRFFLEKNPDNSIYALAKAVADWDEEMIKIIISFWKNNEEFCKFNVNSSIIFAIEIIIKNYISVPPQITVPNLDVETLNKIRFILEMCNK